MLIVLRCLVFGLSLLDRTNISAAYIAGLAEDLRLDIGARYNIALLIFFPGYALFELPSNYVIRRIGARYWLSFLIIAWGCCVLGMGFIGDWRSLTALRAFLGVFEAGLFPGAIYIIGESVETWSLPHEPFKSVPCSVRSWPVDLLGQVQACLTSSRSNLLIHS